MNKKRTEGKSLTCAMVSDMLKYPNNPPTNGKKNTETLASFALNFARKKKRREKEQWRRKARENGWLYFTDLQLHYILARFADVDTGRASDDRSCNAMSDKAGKELRRREKIR